MGAGSWYRGLNDDQRSIIRIGIYGAIYIIIFQVVMMAVFIHFATADMRNLDWYLIRFTLSNIDAFGTLAFVVFLYKAFTTSGRLQKEKEALPGHIKAAVAEILTQEEKNVDAKSTATVRITHDEGLSG